MVSAVRNFGTKAAEIGTKPPFVSDPNGTPYCEICASASGDANTAADGLDDTASGVVDALLEVKKMIEDTFTNVQTQIESGISKAETAVGNAIDILNIQLSNVVSVSLTSAQQVKAQSQSAGISFYAIWFLLIIVTMAGVGLMASNKVDAELKDGREGTGLGVIGKCGAWCVGCGWFWTCAFGAYFLVLGAMMFIVVVMLSATCIIVNEVPTSLSEYEALGVGAGPISVSGLVDTCWADKSIYDALNMTDTLKFGDSEQLNFTRADVDVSKAFKNDALSSLSSAVNSLTVEGSFGYNAQTQSATIQGCTAECVDTSSSTGSGRWNFTSTCGQKPRDQACCENFCKDDNATRYTQLSGHITDLQAKMKDVETTTAAVEQSVKKFQKDIGKMQDIISPVLEDVLKIFDVRGCGFLREQYEAFEAIMCNDVLSAVTFIIATVYVLGILSGPMCCAGCFINKVCGGHGPVPEDNDDLDYLEKEIEFSGAAVKK